MLPPDSDRGQILRNKWEKMWMARLNSYIPQGLNMQDCRLMGTAY